MSDPTLLHLAQELEWLGCELEYYGHKHAIEGFPEAGPLWDTFREKQRGVLTTTDKIERELKNAVSYNPTQLVGFDYPIATALDTISDLITAVEDIKQSAFFAVEELPAKVRAFTKMIESYVHMQAGVGR
jgi:hypothetical protein